MAGPEFSRGPVRFGVFEIDLRSGELRKLGLRLRLQEQPFKILAKLLERPGEVVSREELVRCLWPDGTFVDFEHGLNAAVTRLRQVLGDSAEAPRYVETVAKRGYRFLLPVEPVSELATARIPPQAQTFRARQAWWLAGVFTILVAAFAISLWARRTHTEARLEQITRDPGLATEPALSPDGKLLAYSSDRGGENLNIWVKQLTEDGRALQLTHDASDAHEPSFSPDGSRIVYRSGQNGGGLFVIPAIGGEPQRLGAAGRDPRFSPDGRWIAYWVGGVTGSAPAADASGAVFVIPASGGEPRRIAPDLPPNGYPIWSPDSTHLLIYANSRIGASAEGADWWMVPLQGGGARKTGAFAQLLSQGFLLQFASGLPRASSWVDDTVTFSAQKGDSRSIWKIRFRNSDASVSGTAERLTLGTALDAFPSSIGQDSLVFASLNKRMAIWSLPVDASEGRVAGELQRVTDGETMEVTPSISADGKTLVYGSTVPNHEDIWLKDLQTGRETAVANTAAAEWHPVISRDGSMVAYTVDDTNVRAIRVVPASGGKARQVASGGWIFDWTFDKQQLMFDPKCSDQALKRIDLASGTASNFLEKPGVSLYQSKVSPDGKWLAFEAVFGHGADGSDSRLLVVKTQDGLPAPGHDWILVSGMHGWSDKPRWSPDGNTLYFVSDRDGSLCIWAQRLDPATKHPVSDPLPIYHFHKSRLSPMNVGLALLEIDVASDKIVMGLGELTGNIWRLTRQ